MRFHIIPILYRQFFPENLKSHKSHDVVLLCFECHEKANKLYEKKINEISVKNNVPLIVLSDNSKKFSILIELNKKCKGLIKNFHIENGKEKIQKKIFESLNEIKNNQKQFEDFINYLKLNEININNYNEIDIKIAECISKYKINSISNRDKKNIHGQLVLEKINALNDINELKNFIRNWRQFFLDSFQPKFLPTEWSVNHEMIRTFGQLSQFKNTNS
jgi:cation-transporting P-type ATPase D